MNLRKDRLKTVALVPITVVRDEEGSTSTEYGEKIPFKAEVWAAGGRLQQEMYGAKLPQVRNLRIDGKYIERSTNSEVIYHVTSPDYDFDISVGDYVCLNDLESEKPEYKVTAIYPYSFLQVEVEHI